MVARIGPALYRGLYSLIAIASALSSEQRKKEPYNGGSLNYDEAAVMICVILAAVVYSSHEYVSRVPLMGF